MPLLSGHACLIGTHLAALGYCRLCVGTVLQQRRGLRPSEMLGLMREDLSSSHEAGTGGAARVDIALGARTDTKTNRAQNVSVYIGTDPDLCLALRWTHDSTLAGTFVPTFN